MVQLQKHREGAEQHSRINSKLKYMLGTKTRAIQHRNEQIVFNFPGWFFNNKEPPSLRTSND